MAEGEEIGEAQIRLPEPLEAETGEVAEEAAEAKLPKEGGDPVIQTPLPMGPARSIGNEAEELGGVLILRTSLGRISPLPDLHNEK